MASEGKKQNAANSKSLNSDLTAVELEDIGNWLEYWPDSELPMHNVLGGFPVETDPSGSEPHTLVGATSQPQPSGYATNPMLNAGQGFNPLGALGCFQGGFSEPFPGSSIGVNQLGAAGLARNSLTGSELQMPGVLGNSATDLSLLHGGQLQSLLPTLPQGVSALHRYQDAAHLGTPGLLVPGFMGQGQFIPVAPKQQDTGNTH